MANNSSVAIMVTGVRLYDCVNISNPCTLIPVKITVLPHTRRRIVAVRASNEQREYSYRYSWTWSTAAQRPAP